LNIRFFKEETLPVEEAARQRTFEKRKCAMEAVVLQLNEL